MGAQAYAVGQQGPPRRDPGRAAFPWRGGPPILRVVMTTAAFYRAEAAHCRDRAEKAGTPERAARWRRLAEDYLRIAEELEAAEGPSVAPE
jgi:hypothetical protein